MDPEPDGPGTPSDPDATQATPTADPGATQATPTGPDATQAIPPGEPREAPTQALPTQPAPPGPPPTEVLPAAPPPPPPPVPDDASGADQEPPGGGGRLRVALVVALAVLFALAVGIAAFLLTAGDDPEPQAVEVLLEPHDLPGDDPFTSDVARRADATRARALADLDPGQPPADTGAAAAPPALDDQPVPDPAALHLRVGIEPGLYGAVRGESSCDRDQLADDLAADAARRSAWTSLQGVREGEVEEFLARTTPVVLLHDVRVTDHHYVAGAPAAHQAILQAGTSVLIDPGGAPVVRCTSGNPVGPAVVHAQVLFVGTPWAGFDPDRVIAIQAGSARSEFTLVDLPTGTLFTRPAGSGGGSDDTTTTTTTTTTEPPETTTTTTTTSTTTSTTSPPTTQPDPEPTEVTRLGSTSASSVFDSSTGPERAVDGDRRTSWFGGGSDADPDGSEYRWEADERFAIESIVVVGNGSNSNPDLRTSTGFESVTIEVLDGGAVVFSETFGLPGTPDPTITVQPATTGDAVRLLFTGSERPDIGGFAELSITALR